MFALGQATDSESLLRAVRSGGDGVMMPCGSLGDLFCQVSAGSAMNLDFFIRQVLDTDELIVRMRRTGSSNLACKAAPSRFCVFWIMKTIRNVMIVVPVLLMSCHVSE
jgi:hypothetical protein